MNLKRSLILLLTIIFITVNVAGVLLYERYKDIKESEEWVAHTYEVISKLQGLSAKIENVIAVQRGYLISGRENSLISFRKSSKNLDQEIANLQHLTLDNIPQQKRLLAVRKETDFLQSLLNKKVDAVRQNGQQHIQIDDDIILVKRTADVIRYEISTALQNEKNLLDQRRQKEKSQENYYFNTLIASVAISIMIVLLSNGLILTLSSRHKAVARDLDIASQDLFKTRERLELAMRGTSDGVFDWNFKTNEFYFSPRFWEMLGYQETELSNTLDQFKSLLHPEDLDEVTDNIQLYLLHQIDKYAVEFRIQHKDGTWRWHLARGATPVQKETESFRLVGAHTEITTQKETEIRLRAINKELEEFTYIASHDLRSPLVNLKGFASELQYCVELIRDFVRRALPVVQEENKEEISNIVEKDMPECLSFISSSVTKMERLTRAILELSRIGRRKLEFELLPIRTIVDNCIKPLQHQIATRNITINIGDLPDITGDTVAIEQVFGNIIDNAIKYLDPSRPGVITISGIQSVSETTYHIKDNGRGIREEDLTKVFEIFKRAGNNENIQGEGMGMSYVQTIIRRHGGIIWCTSVLGEGTDFYFTIPHHFRRDLSNV